MASDKVSCHGGQLYPDDVLYHGRRLDASLFFKMLMGDFTGLEAEAVAGEFNTMLGNPVLMGSFMVVVVLLCFGVCAMGLQQGVERITKVMMVCLLGLMVVLAVHSMILPGGGPGLEFYLKPDFGKMKEAGLGDAVFAALGQSFLR